MSAISSRPVRGAPVLQAASVNIWRMFGDAPGTQNVRLQRNRTGRNKTEKPCITVDVAMQANFGCVPFNTGDQTTNLGVRSSNLFGRASKPLISVQNFCAICWVLD